MQVKPGADFLTALRAATNNQYKERKKKKGKAAPLTKAIHILPTEGGMTALGR